MSALTCCVLTPSTDERPAASALLAASEKVMDASARAPNLHPRIVVALVRSLPRSAGRTDIDGCVKLPGPAFSPPFGFLFGSGGDCVSAAIAGQIIEASSRTAKVIAAPRAVRMPEVIARITILSRTENLSL